VRIRADGGRSETDTNDQPALTAAKQEQLDDWEEVRSKVKRAVILGAPGFGKTWLFRQEGRRVAREQLADLKNGNTRAPTVLPAYIRLDALATEIGKGMRALRDDDADVRWAAAEAFDSLGERGLERLLKAWTRAEEIDVRVHMYEVLAQVVAAAYSKTPADARVSWRAQFVEPTAWTLAANGG
jgi:hypothetical protein